MIEPYTAVALQTTVRNIATRERVQDNLTHIGNMIDLVAHICSLELPVRLIMLGEGAIQGFVDEILHLTPAEYCQTMAADIPGWETEALGEKAKQHGCYIMGTLKSKHPKFPDRFFNTIFMVDPTGEVCYQHQKNIVLHVEHSTTPHDVYDDWVAEHGDGIDAFFPVAKTDIGNIAGSVGVEGAFPESYRAFALNGAEIFYRGSLPEPWVSRGIFETQNRARAMDNTCYMVAPNTGSLIVQGPPGTEPTVVGGALGGRSSIIDYKGDVLASSTVVDDCYVAAEINIEALRYYRETSHFQNWLPYLRTEIFKGLYDQPVWPANKPPMSDTEVDETFKDVVKTLKSRGAYTKSGY